MSAIYSSKLTSLCEMPLHRKYLYLAMIAEGHSDEEIAELIRCLSGKGVSAVGGIFPGLILNGEPLWKGGLLVELGEGLKFSTIENLSEKSIDELIKELSWLKDIKAGTLLLLVDGFSHSIPKFLEAVSFLLDRDVIAVGCGAGSMKNTDRKSLISNAKAFHDGALVIHLPKRVKVGVKHGWTQLFGPLLVTDSEGNLIKQLNWEPAFEVYKRVLEENASVRIEKDNFFDIAKGFPLGMLREGNEPIIRDPISVQEDGSILCVGDVPKNSVVFIMKGDKESLVSAVREACPEGKEGLIFDCISRVLFLQRDISEEMRTISEKLKDFSGCFSVGEIVSLENEGLQILNKTFVGVSYEW